MTNNSNSSNLSLLDFIQVLNPFAPIVWNFSFNEEIPKELLNGRCLGIFEFLNQSDDFKDICNPETNEFTRKMTLKQLYNSYKNYLKDKQYEIVSYKTFYKELNKVLEFSKVNVLKGRTAKLTFVELTNKNKINPY